MNNFDYDHNYHLYGDTDPETGCLTCFFTAIILGMCLLFGLLFSGCSPKVIENTIVKHDTCFAQKERRDSIYMHDSIYVHEYMKGDTVYRDRDRWHTEWRERIVRDTAYVSHTDTVRVTKTQQVAKPLSGWQWFQIWAGRLAMLAITLAVGFYAFRLIARRTLLL